MINPACRSLQHRLVFATWLVRAGATSAFALFFQLTLIALLMVASGFDARSEPTGAKVKAGGVTDRLREFGVTWIFAEPVTYGQFANGHYWVVGPVTVKKILPEFDGKRHGWEVNPTTIDRHGFDSRISEFDAGNVPRLPYKAQPNESLVKVVSIKPAEETGCRPCIKSASVLTVLGEVPPDKGQTVFRPPYFGASKPLISVAQLQTQLLPALKPTNRAPSFASVALRYRMVQLDHKIGWTGRKLHPADAMPDYGSDIAARNAASALTFMLKGAMSEKRTGLIRYINNGIDIYYMFRGGVRWPPAGGHAEGRKLPAVFASVLLNDEEMKETLRTAPRDAFGETGGVYKSKSNGKVLYGQAVPGEEEYWRSVVFDVGSRTLSDPYFFIDGGQKPGHSYDFCCLAQNWKATVSALLLMPALRDVFNGEDLVTYVKRWMSHGAITQPDPCAPPLGSCVGGGNAGEACTSANAQSICHGQDAICDLRAGWDQHYAKTYGPAGDGQCIKDQDPRDGTGRFPLSDGLGVGAGWHNDPFADEMWAVYAHKAK